MAQGDTYNPLGNTQTSDAEAREHQGTLLAKRVTEIPSDLQMQVDYDTRTDSNPIYVGYGPKGLATSTTGWLLQKFTYDSSNRVTVRQVAYDKWTLRTTASYS